MIPELDNPQRLEWFRQYQEWQYDRLMESADLESNIVDTVYVESLLAKLPAPMQRLIYYHHWMGLSFAEIAKSGLQRGRYNPHSSHVYNRHIKASAIQYRYRAALKMLRRMIEAEGLPL